MKIQHLKTLILSSALLATTALTGWAATCSVPTAGYPTIQSAVDDPTCTVIDVAAGLYPENVTISRSVTLNGAQAGQAVSARTSGGPSESTVAGANPLGAQAVFQIAAPSVTIDGFTVKNAVTSGAATGVDINGGSNDAVVLNNFIDGIENTAGTAQGVFIRNGSVNMNIASNDVRNIVATAAATGVVVGENNATTGTDIVFIHDNKFSAITSASDRSAAAACFKAFPNSTAFYFRNNHVSNLTGATATHAVSLETDLIIPLVIENDFAGLTSPTGDVAAIWFNNDPSVYSADTGGNLFFLTEADYGVQIAGGASTAVYPPPMSSGCNWWGSADGPGPVGPGHGCKISAGLRYSPWRVTPTTDVGACIGNNVPTGEMDCKGGGWITHVRADGSIFKNQGDCVQYLNNSK